MPRTTGRGRALLILLLLALVATTAGACGGNDTDADTDGAAGSSTSAASEPPTDATLSISSIPDQDPDKLAARDGAMADHLSDALGVDVEYVPVTDYAASVSLLRAGDLDLVFYGGLTGVQARLADPNVTLVAQRDIDESFRSVFIANSATGIAPISDVGGLSVMAGRRFTFGSESSTSGRLMPQYFLDQAGVGPNDFEGEAGFSGSHDKTVDLVQSGSYEAGALNAQVWKARTAAGTVDTSAVVEVFTTPPYHDYHWIAGSGVDEEFGEGFTDRIADAIIGLDPADPAQAAVLTGYGAKAFTATEPANYANIEEIGRTLGLIGG